VVYLKRSTDKWVYISAKRKYKILCTGYSRLSVAAVPAFPDYQQPWITVAGSGKVPVPAIF